MFNKIHYEKQADQIRATFDMHMHDLTNRVLKEATDEFREKFPKRTMCLMFGMGGHSMWIDGEHVDIDCAIPYRLRGESFTERRLRPLIFFAERLAFLDEVYSNGIDGSDIFVVAGSKVTKAEYDMDIDLRKQQKEPEYVGVVTIAKTNTRHE